MKPKTKFLIELFNAYILGICVASASYPTRIGLAITAGSVIAAYAYFFSKEDR